MIIRHVSRVILMIAVILGGGTFSHAEELGTTSLAHQAAGESTHSHSAGTLQGVETETGSPQTEHLAQVEVHCGAPMLCIAADAVPIKFLYERFRPIVGVDRLMSAIQSVETPPPRA